MLRGLGIKPYNTNIKPDCAPTVLMIVIGYEKMN